MVKNLSMGRNGGSSSKRKSSKKKTSETRMKKRVRRIKSRKRQRRDDIVSSYSDDDSSSSLFSSSSSSEDDYKSRRGRSRTKGGGKGSKKRSRRSYSSGSSRDSPSVKKRKGSKKKGVPQVRKINRKKKHRRDADTSDPVSCSTCSSGSCSTCNESEPESPMGRSVEKKKGRPDPRNRRSRDRKRRDRSRSVSSNSKLGDNEGDNSYERMPVDNNSGRLKSVIAVINPTEEKEGYEQTRDELKEEIVCDHDDYPSRSNDSHDGGNKRESAHDSYNASEKVSTENVVGQAASISKPSNAKPTSFGNDVRDKDDGQNGESNTASATIGTDGESLEAILRQKALENLTRFRGSRQTNAVVLTADKNNIASNLKQLSTVKADICPSSGTTVQSQPAVPKSRFTWRRDSSVAGTTEEQNQRGKSSGTDSRSAKYVVQQLPGKTVISAVSEDKDHIVGTQASKVPQLLSQEKSSLIKTVIKKSGTEISKAESRTELPGKTVISAVSEHKDHIVRSQASKVPEPLSQERYSLTKSVVNKTGTEISKAESRTGEPAVQQLPDKKGISRGSDDSEHINRLQPSKLVKTFPKEESSLVNSTVNNSTAESTKANAEVGSDHGGSSAIGTPSVEEKSSRQQPDEPKDGSQFEKKTMSVMKGGEMVQVSYKVYIPKTTPALARRKLKR